MKKPLKITLWIISVFHAIIALLFFTAGVLPGLLMLLCAALINPLCLERMNKKRRKYIVWLEIGLWILSIASISGLNNQKAVREIQGEAESPVRIELQNVAAKEIPVDTIYEKPAADSTVTTPAPYNEGELQTGSTGTSDQPTATQPASSTPTPEQQTPKQESERSAGIEILSYTETVGRGEFASIEIQGMPNEDYTCSVKYKTTMSTADGLGVKKSDSEGLVIWRWKVGTRTSLDYRPTISIQGGGDSISVKFQVVE